MTSPANKRGGRSPVSEAVINPTSLLDLTVTWVPIEAVRPSPRNARTHPNRQINQLVGTIQHNRVMTPMLADEKLDLIAGHGRLEAAKRLGLKQVPVIILKGLTRTQKRALMLADNKIAANAGWDSEKRAAELIELVSVENIDLDVLGFSAVEYDQIVLDHEDSSADPADTIPAGSRKAISRPGDVWELGNHRILCGDSREKDDLQRLMGLDRAAVVWTDPPYNLEVKGLVGRGKIKHAEFAMASGEMESAEFRSFLKLTLGNAADYSLDNAIHYACMDWRHIEDLLAIAREIYAELLNLIAWVKSNAGQGSFYRSQHELIGVFRVGASPHLNNIELGRHGRNRSNVWQYAGVNSFGKGRLADLASHPTVKPVAMIVDALKDCSKRGDIVLDIFGGSGSTLMACERIGRRARLLECEPAFVDVTVRRWQEFTGRDAVHADSGQLFDMVAAEREER